MYTKKCTNDIHTHVVSVVHTSKSINSHVINNFIINTLISYIMITHIILYTDSLVTGKHIHIEVTDSNNQCMF